MSIGILVLVFYVIVNFVMGIVFFNDGFLGGDFYGEKIDNKDLFLWVLGGELLLLITFYAIAVLIVKFTFNKRYPEDYYTVSELALKRFNIFLIVLQTSFILFIFATGFGRISLLMDENSSAANINSPIKYIFVILLPDFLFIVYFLVQKNNKKTIVNLSLYLISNIVRGWVSGPVLLIMAIFLVKKFSFKKIKIKIKTIISLVTCFIIFVPLVTSLKFGVRFQNDEISAVDLVQDSIENNVSYYLRTLNRFQHISEAYSFMDSMTFIRKDYADNRIALPFFTNDFINITSKIFSFEPQNLLTYGSKVLLDRPFGNIQSGILPWLSIDYFFSISYILTFFIFTILLSRFCKMLTLGYPVSKNIVIWFTIYYYAHGWLFSYMNLLIAMMIFIIFSKVFRGKILNKDNNYA
ncbi:TPA: O28ab family O-antigen polymerase [Escherichia coli]|nr:O28ab family O-antigen polymerase [Escherichia coli]